MAAVNGAEHRLEFTVAWERGSGVAAPDDEEQAFAAAAARLGLDVFRRRRPGRRRSRSTGR